MYLDEWIAERKNTVSAGTQRVHESIIRSRIKPHIGTVILCKLSGKDIRELHRRLLSNGLSASTVGHTHRLLKQVMRDAVRDKYIRDNPLDEVKPPKQKGNGKKPVLDAEQLERLFETVRGDRFECAFYLMALCGLRIGECLALTFDSLDLERGTIRIEHTLYNGQRFDTKTPSSRATLTLPQRALEALRRHCDGLDGGGYLFATSSGKPVDVSNFHKWTWKPALRKAGLPENLTPHGLRHGTGSLLAEQNVPLPVISRYLRHANPRITSQVYLHELGDTSGVASAAMDAALG
jgi:integrase